MDLAVREINAAWAMCPSSINVLTVATYGLAELGRRTEAIELLMEALKVHKPTEAILTLIVKIAMDLELPDIAKKVLELIINLNPSEPDHYIAYAQCLHRLGESDEAIGLMQATLPQFPQSAGLWNVLGVITLQHLNNVPSARAFFNEALKYDPDHVQALANLAEVNLNKGGGLGKYEQALAADPENPELKLGLAMALLQQQEFERAWDLYEARFSEKRGSSKSLTYSHQFQYWHGENLERRTLFLAAEQGLGDEVFFAIFFERVREMVGQLVIGCDPRLKSIYERSFPGVKIVPYVDTVRLGVRTRSFPEIEPLGPGMAGLKVDKALPIGSLPRVFWQSLDKISTFQGGYLKADPERQQKMAEQLARNSKLPRIGLSWRSGNLREGREHGYIGLEMAKVIAAIPGIQIVNLQYEADDNELEILSSIAGDRFINMDKLDLKQDIEANLAIMANLDLVIGSSTATQSLAMAQGVETWCVHRGTPWWVFGLGKDVRLPFAKNYRFLYINYAKNYRAESERQIVDEIEKWLSDRR